MRKRFYGLFCVYSHTIKCQDSRGVSNLDLADDLPRVVVSGPVLSGHSRGVPRVTAPELRQPVRFSPLQGEVLPRVPFKSL